jgi:hypothetical protein
VFLDAAGQFASAAPVSLAEPRFLAVDDLKLYVLDCDADRQLVALDWNGAALCRRALPALSDVVTGLFATSEGPCVEVAHERSFLVSETTQAVPSAGLASLSSSAAATVGSATATASQAMATSGRGKPAPATLHELAGRPIDPDLGRVASVTFRPGQNAQVRSYKVDRSNLKATKTADFSHSLASGRAIDYLVSVDGDGNGGLVIGARLQKPETRGGTQASLVLTRLASSGTGVAGVAGASDEADVLFLADSPFAYLGQPYVVAPDGRILQPVGSDDGYSIFVHAFPGIEAEAGAEEVEP